jgi:hypothetical protein
MVNEQLPPDEFGFTSMDPQTQKSEVFKDLNTQCGAWPLCCYIYK